jgi:hypothetical protein
MDEDPKSSTQEISSELFGSKLELKKIFNTFLHVFKNIKVVIDDFNQGTGNYTRPVKYALSVMAPYVVIMQLFDIDMTSQVIEYGKQANAEQVAANPEIGPILDNYYSIFSRGTEIMYEFLPVAYALLFVPVFAFWIRIFFRRKNLNFSFYYALGTYVMMSLVALTFPINLLALLGFLDLTLAMQISLLITLLFYIYSVYRVFRDGIFETVVKMVLVNLLMFATIVIPAVIIVFILAFATLH